MNTDQFFLYEYNYIILSLLQNLADKISDLVVSKQAKSSKQRKARGIPPASEEKVQQMFDQLALEKKPCVQLRVEESTYANFIPLQMKTPLPKPMSYIHIIVIIYYYILYIIYYCLYRFFYTCVNIQLHNRQPFLCIKPKQSFTFKFLAQKIFLVLVNYTSN